MAIHVDLSNELGEEYSSIHAAVIAILIYERAKLYAVTVDADGAPWFGLIHEDSTAFLGEV